MAGVSDYGDLNLSIVGHLVNLAMLIGSHGDLETSAQCLELVSGAHITILQARPHGVDVEERVLSVLDVRARVPVQGLVALVADSRQI